MKTDIHTIIDMLHSDPVGISTKFGIPIRTVYHWCSGSRRPPEYLITMMLNIILLERRLNNGQNTYRLGEGMEGNTADIQEDGQKSKSETCKA